LRVNEIISQTSTANITLEIGIFSPEKLYRPCIIFFQSNLSFFSQIWVQNKHSIKSRVISMEIYNLLLLSV